MSHLLNLATRRLSSAGSILCFHSATGPGFPSASATHVPLDLLESALHAARRLGDVVPVRELAARHLQGRSTAGMVSLTFDDAYAALLQLAGDLFERMQLPVTIFVATDAAAQGDTFWWDRIEDLRPAVSRERWLEFERDCGFEPQSDSAEARAAAFRDWVLGTHKGRWPESLQAVLATLEQEAGVTTAQRSMTFAQIRELARRAPVEVGVHTCTHPLLPALGDAELQGEISGCHATLRREFNDVVPLLAVPFGLFDRRTIAAARAAGMQASLSLTGRSLAHCNEAYEIPRMCMTREDSVGKLHLKLAGIADRIRSWRGETVSYPELPAELAHVESIG